jgi:hypothetical protein
MAAKLTNTRIYNTGSNEHIMVIQLFSLLSKRGSKIYKNCKETERRNIKLPGTVIKV